MKFQFNVSISDDDYLDYNKFWMMRSHYGKKQVTTIRILIAVFFALYILILLCGEGFTFDSFIGVIPMMILLILAELLFMPLYVVFLKWLLKGVKKKGKMAYSSSAVIEFYEDGFVEITEVNKTEQKYSVVERISVVDNKMIYIHVNNVMAYMLPFSSFRSEEERNSFFEFIKTKCTIIDIY